jgi:hypothetical protein
MIIYGAGMSGLLAATMLRRFDPVIHEAAPELPNNHAALLRFRTDAVSRETGIPFKKVWVQKAVWDSHKSELTTEPNLMLQNLYSMKVSGTIKNRSIGNLSPGERYIAPEDFIAQMAKKLDICYNSSLDKETIDSCDKNSSKISTVPMNILMKIAGWSDIPKFEYKEITTVTATISNFPCEVYQTIYVPQLSYSAYRVSITGDKLIVECIGSLEADFCKYETFLNCYLKMFFGEAGASRVQVSNIQAKNQKYGKLVNSTGRMGKEFILAMTDLHGIYSLGRFATWRQILMDDVVKDIRVIEQMIEQRDSYSRRLRA